MSFCKLDSGIVNSSIWSEPLATRILWITMLAMGDENGFVSTSLPGLIRAANISKEEFVTGIKALESPDEYSRTSEYEGRRVEHIEGGWIILNFKKYRERSEIIREQTRERVRKHRDKIKDVTHCNVTETLLSASSSESSSISKKEKPVKHRYGEYKHVLLTETQFEKLTSEFGVEKRDDMIKDLDEGIQMKGYKYTDHNLAMRKWNKKNSKGSGQQGLFNQQPAPVKTDYSLRRIPTEGSIMRIEIYKKWPEAKDWEYSPDGMNDEEWLWIWKKMYHQTYTPEVLKEIKARYTPNV